MRKIGAHSFFVLLLVAAHGSPTGAQTFAWDFNAGQDGWEGGYSDYSGESDFQFEFARAYLPKPLDTAKFGLMLKGMNRSDDMFMFLRRKVEGLAPSARYDVRFKVRLASQYATDGVGIGGSPGASVFLKVGATASKPVDMNGRMNIEKGNQANPGRDMDTIGTVAVGPGINRYTTIERTNGTRVFTVTAAADGTAWIILGTDSGFEGLTVLYYQGVEAVFTKQGGTAVLGLVPGTVGTGMGSIFRVDGRAVPGGSKPVKRAFALKR